MAQTPSSEVINTFTGRHDFLSPNYCAPLSYRGRTAPSLAHHYWAARAPSDKVREFIYDAPVPAVARRIALMHPAPAGWDQHQRSEVMGELLQEKFQGHLLDQLLGTGDALLLTTNLIHDQFWGACLCARHAPWPGKNRLGITLMQLRSELRGDSARPRYARVSLAGYRPKDLSEADHQWVRETLPWVLAQLREEHGMSVGISGMSSGPDILWAQSVLTAGLSLWAYLPYPGQAQRWPEAEQRKWRQLRQLSSREVVMGSDYSVSLFHARNELMVRDCDLLISIQHPRHTTGGAATTVRKAQQTRRAQLHLDLELRRVVLNDPSLGGPVEWGRSAPHTALSGASSRVL